MYLFVYGSLMEGFFNHEKALVGKIVSRKIAYMYGELFHIENKGYPALIEGKNKIYGELLELPDEEPLLVKLDEIENFNHISNSDNEYIREMIEIQVENQSNSISAYVYKYNLDANCNRLDNLVPVKSGMWREYMQEFKENIC